MIAEPMPVRVLKLACLFGIVLGARCWIADAYVGSLAPSFAWLKEAPVVLGGSQAGYAESLAASWEGGFAPLYFVFSRALIEANMQWDARLWAGLGSVFWAGSSVLTVLLLRDAFRSLGWNFLLLLSSVVFSLAVVVQPNLIAAGLQSALLVFFSLLAIRAFAVPAPLRSRRRWLGLAAAGLGALSHPAGWIAAVGPLLLCLSGPRHGDDAPAPRRIAPDALVLAAILVAALVACILQSSPYPPWFESGPPTTPLEFALVLLVLAGFGHLLVSLNREQSPGLPPAFRGAVAIGVFALCLGAFAGAFSTAIVLALLVALVPLQFLAPERPGAMAAGIGVAAAATCFGILIVQTMARDLPAFRKMVRSESEAARIAVRSNPASPPANPEAQSTFRTPVDVFKDGRFQALLPADVRKPLELIHANSGDRAFLPGVLPPGFANPGDVVILSSHTADKAGKKGNFLSGPISSPYPYLSLRVSRQLGQKALDLHVVGEGFRKRLKPPGSMHVRGWREIVFRNPGKPFQIEASDRRPKGWFAFSRPVEIGGLTHASDALLRSAPWLVGASAFLLYALLLLDLRRFRVAHRAASSTEDRLQ